MAKDETFPHMLKKLMEQLGFLYGAIEDDEQEIADYPEKVDKILNMAKRLDLPGFEEGLQQYHKRNNGEDNDII